MLNKKINITKNDMHMFLVTCKFLLKAPYFILKDSQFMIKSVNILDSSHIHLSISGSGYKPEKKNKLAYF